MPLPLRERGELRCRARHEGKRHPGVPTPPTHHRHWPQGPRAQPGDLQRAAAPAHGPRVHERGGGAQVLRRRGAPAADRARGPASFRARGSQAGSRHSATGACTGIPAIVATSERLASLRICPAMIRSTVLLSMQLRHPDSLEAVQMFAQHRSDTTTMGYVRKLPYRMILEQRMRQFAETHRSGGGGPGRVGEDGTPGRGVAGGDRRRAPHGPRRVVPRPGSRSPTGCSQGDCLPRGGPVPRLLEGPGRGGRGVRCGHDCVVEGARGRRARVAR